MTVLTRPLQSTPITQPFSFGGDESGFGIAQLPASGGPRPAFLWHISLRVEGDKGDQCSRFTFGGVQSVIKYRARATWKSGTTWEWYIVHKLPIRDALDPNSPWYDKDKRFIVDACNQSIQVEHGDSPSLKSEGKALIPWNDPFTKEKDSIDSVKWEAAFAAFLIQMDPSGKIKEISRIGWKLEVWVSFDHRKSFNERGNFVRNNVDPFKSAPGSPQIKGPIGGTPKIAKFRKQAEADRKFGPF